MEVFQASWQTVGKVFAARNATKYSLNLKHRYLILPPIFKDSCEDCVLFILISIQQILIKLYNVQNYGGYGNK